MRARRFLYRLRSGRFDRLVYIGEPDGDGREAILDIQRSLDFYESNVARRPVRKVLIAPLGMPLPGLVEYLDTYLNPEVGFLDLEQILEHKHANDDNNEQITTAVLPAISAAMRALEVHS